MLYKRIIGKLTGMGLCVVLGMCASQLVMAEEQDEYLASIEGTYTELFPAMDLEENRQIWYDNLAEFLNVEDEETAETLRQNIISMFSSEIYGAAAEKEASGIFNCFFIEGISELTVDGNTISGCDEDGNEVFSHTYTHVEDIKYDFGDMNEAYSAYYTDETWPTMAIYESDGDDDAFKYFAFCGDSPEESYHIEFRYGGSLDGITAYFNGDYAYWLASGFLKDAPEGMMDDCINLFVSENAGDFVGLIEE